MKRSSGDVEITLLESGESDPGPDGSATLRTTLTGALPGAGRSFVARAYESALILPQVNVFDTLVNLDHVAGIDDDFGFLFHDAQFAASHDVFSNGNSDGSDIQVWNEAKTVRYPAHVIAYDAGAELLRVKALVPVMAQNDKLTLRRVLSGGVAPAATDPFGLNAVYAGEAMASVTLEGGPDDTGNVVITNTTGTPGTLDGYPIMNFDGDISDRAITDFVADSPVICGRAYGQFSAADSDLFNKGGVRFNWQGFWLVMRDYSDGTALWNTSGPDPSAAPTFIAFTHDGSDPANLPEIVANAAAQSVANNVARAGTLNANSAALSIGGRPSGESITGGAGFAAWRHTIPSTAWLIAEQVNHMTPAAFATADAGALGAA